MLRPGPRNAITDVAGLRVGQAQDAVRTTGVSVILPDRRVPAAADVRGGGPGTRETDILGPASAVEAVDALVFSGGSAFGLSAADGVMDWLRAEGRGFEAAGHRIPIVPAAILFDLAPGDPLDWESPPWRRLAAEAVAAASETVALGSAGAGMGASIGPRALKGGVGTASVTDGGLTVGALAAANPLGSVLMPGSRTFWTWWLEMAGELGGQTPPAAAPADLDPLAPIALAPGRSNTTLVAVATDAALDRAGLARVAMMAQEGIARAVRPGQTPFDGDAVFALATGTGAPERHPVAIARIGALAADCVARAIMRGVYEARPLGGMPAYRDLAA